MTIIANERDVTPAVQKVMERTSDPRLREIMKSLITHLHAFVRDVRLTEAEFQQATRILNTMGQQSNDKHNEFVLMAGSLGVSSLVCLLNNGDNGATETTQSLLGPFWRMDQPMTENGGSILRSDTPGPRLYGTFRFQDQDGKPVEGLEVDIWHASPVGLYENQDDSQADYNLRGKFITGADGIVRFKSVKPIGYPIPTGTTVGQLLKAQDRHPYRPAHVHVLAHKQGFKTLINQTYVDETDYLTSDVQFGVTEALIGKLERHDRPHPEDGEVGEWYSLEHTLTMEPGESRLPIPPIK
ncbi:MAG TPA: dioxygenase [Amaricoccus sp.]|uniref:dioxygenase family protein n=1 Tax=Amaricoccus sp. TaxID=1872485 RepID=UPI002B90CFED|nr:dioxygenase [Amaricoccus sp.]HMQ95006.1 dioxygenase [Amaricoccus sp.]HMR37811.1 dioxygenase [Paracoccus sp. (in: a-proteobacteria)]HMR54809.1 dioxygenase [Amaricoccus sp.]HMU01851.1 dioxygenase [Amaricoccus sp.]